jgi:hypothetical protein
VAELLNDRERVDRSTETPEARAVRDHGVDPHSEQNLNALICISHRVASDVIARGCQNWPFAMLVDDDLKSSNEDLRVVQVKRASEVSVVVEELEFIASSLEPVARGARPDFAHQDSRTRRLMSVR